MIEAETLKQVAAIITAVGVPITALGTIVLAVMTRRQGEVQARQTETIKQVGKTGDAVHTLVNSNMGVQLRISAVALRRVAEMTHDPDDAHAANLAEDLLSEHAAKQARVDAKEEKAK